MSSLSEEMKSKRDIRRINTVLIVDKDLGNMGLYKSILAQEFDVNVADSLTLAIKLCKSSEYDVIVVDDNIGIDNITDFFDWLKDVQKDTIKLVLTDEKNREIVVKTLCHGGWGNIPKPFTKEGISIVIREAIRKRRQDILKSRIVIIDNDYMTRNALRSGIKHKYDVTVIDNFDDGYKYICKNNPDFLIISAKLPDIKPCEICETIHQNSQISKLPILFITDDYDGDEISACAKYRPEGFMEKPVNIKMLNETLDRLFYMRSYMDSVDEEVRYDNT